MIFLTWIPVGIVGTTGNKCYQGYIRLIRDTLKTVGSFIWYATLHRILSLKWQWKWVISSLIITAKILYSGVQLTEYPTPLGSQWIERNFESLTNSFLIVLPQLLFTIFLAMIHKTKIVYPKKHHSKPNLGMFLLISWGYVFILTELKWEFMEGKLIKWCFRCIILRREPIQTTPWIRYNNVWVEIKERLNSL